MRNILEVLLVLIMLAFALYVSHGAGTMSVNGSGALWVHHMLFNFESSNELRTDHDMARL